MRRGRNIAVVALLCVGAGLLWHFLSGAGGGSVADASVEGLTREVVSPDQPDEVRTAGELPDQAPQRVAAAPEPTLPVVEAAPVKALIVDQGIFGRVTRKGGEPVARRIVKISYVGSMGGDTLVEAPTDEEGNYAASFSLEGMTGQLLKSRAFVFNEWQEWAERVQKEPDGAELQSLACYHRYLDDRVWLEASVEDEAGFRVARRVDLRPQMPERIRINLLLEQRRDLEGEVLNAKGSVSGAHIMLFDGDYELVATTLADANGKFRMDGPEPGAFVLHARLPGAGAGQVRGTFIGGSIRTPFQTIELGGVMQLLGRVVNPEGQPVSGLPISAIIDSLTQTAENPLWPTPRELAETEFLGALCFSETLTSIAGAFGMTAMEAGNYTLRFGNLPEKYQPEGLFSTGVAHEIVFRGCLLKVYLSGRSEDLIDVRVHCEELVKPDWASARDLLHYVQRVTCGPTAFLLEPGSSWAIYVERDGKSQTFKHVKVSDKDYLTNVKLSVRTWRHVRSQPWSRSASPESDGATLKVSLKDKQAKSCTGLVTLWRVERGGDRLVVARRPIPERGFVGLERGTYRVSVESMEGHAPFLPIVVKGTTSLQPGGTKELAIEVETGGALTLQLTSEESHRGQLFAAHLVPEEASQPQIPLSFEIDGEPWPAPAMSVGASVRCSPSVPPGKYTLIIRSDREGLNIPPQTVEVEAGKVHRLSVEIP